MDLLKSVTKKITIFTAILDAYRANRAHQRKIQRHPVVDGVVLTGIVCHCSLLLSIHHIHYFC